MKDSEEDRWRKAGLTPQTTLVAVNGLAYKPGVLKDAIAQSGKDGKPFKTRSGDTVKLVVSKGPKTFPMPKVLLEKVNQAKADQLLSATGSAGKAIIGQPTTLSVIYSFGDYVSAANVVRSDNSKSTADS